MLSRSLVIALTLGLSTTAAVAGPVGSLSLGGGKLGCETDGGRDCDGDGPVDAGAVTGQLGLMIGHGVAVVGHAQVVAHEDDGVTVSQTVVAGAVRAWLVPRLWLEGGLGVARASVEYMDLDRVSHSETVPAVVGGVGVELVSAAAFALDVNFRAAKGFYDGDMNLYQATIGVGLTIR
jgi:hypothetical protein